MVVAFLSIFWLLCCLCYLSGFLWCYCSTVFPSSWAEGLLETIFLLFRSKSKVCAHIIFPKLRLWNSIRLLLLYIYTIIFWEVVLQVSSWIKVIPPLVSIEGISFSLLKYFLLSKLFLCAFLIFNFTCSFTKL